MDYKKKQEIPFGAFDSKLMYQEINIPEGFEATIEGNAIVLKKTESEDEKIRKALIKGVQDNKNASWTKFGGIDIDEVLAWLEKQGEQNPIAEIKPRFKVGDWIIHDKKGSAFLIAYIDEENQRYIFEIGGYSKEQMNYEDIEFADTHYHLWSIADAKDGDVLASSKSIFLFKGIYMVSKPESYCAIMNGSFINCPEGCWTNEQCYPATKEQCQLLFRKMEEEGYEWDAEKKELNKREFSPDELLEEAYQQQADDLIDMVTKKPAWSEEDEYIMEEIEAIIDAYVLEENDPKALKNWLKSIKERVHLKSQWTDEDEKLFGDVITACYEYYGDFEPWPEIKNWLNNIKQRLQ